MFLALLGVLVGALRVTFWGLSLWPSPRESDRCSEQLHERWRVAILPYFNPRVHHPSSAWVGIFDSKVREINWSGREDLNLRHPGPEDWFHEESTV